MAVSRRLAPLFRPGRRRPWRRWRSGSPASRRAWTSPRRARGCSSASRPAGAPRRWGWGSTHTAVAHSGIDSRFLDPAPAGDWAWRLLYVGRLDQRKGIHTAIEALAHLPEASLSVVGGWDEQEEARLRGLAARLGVEQRTRFEGQREREELPGVYAAADAVVFPVMWEEPWGLVPLEAMGLGRPGRRHRPRGFRGVPRDGENALLFPAGDAPALAAAVERLAADAGLRARLRERGAETAARHTERHFNEAVERFLREAVA